MMLQSIFDHEDIAGSINRTNESMIKILEKKLQEKDSMLQEKDTLIEQLKRQLDEKQ